MTVRIHIIENYDSYFFEEQVNEFLKEWSYKIISYTLGRNIVMVKRSGFKKVNVYRNEALFIVDDELEGKGPRQATLPKINMRNEADRTGAIS